MYDHDNTKEVEELPPALNHNTRLPEIVKQQKVLQLVSDAGKVGLTKMEPPKKLLYPIGHFRLYGNSN